MRAKPKRSDVLESIAWGASVVLFLYALRQGAPDRPIYKGEITFEEALNEVDQDELDRFLETVVHSYEGKSTPVKVSTKSTKVRK